MMRLDRRTLSKATPRAMLRLAKYVGVPIRRRCVCLECSGQLLEVLVRQLDQEAATYHAEAHGTKVVIE
jgi:hypothetical protein